MKTSRVKHRLREGNVALGTFVFEFNSPGIARLAAGAGAEFIVFDMEHNGWSVETIGGLLATCGGLDVVSIVRIPAVEYHFVARVLDVGARGLMAPMVESVAQAEKLVKFARYPPQGRRGAAFGVAHDDYHGGDIIATMQAANREVLLIAQIESAAGLDYVEQIAAVEGIDILWIGHFDLTNSLGIPGQFDHPQFLEAVQRVVAACFASGKAAGIMAGNLEQARWALKEGFTVLAYGGDLWLYQQALREGLDTLRGTE